MDMGANTPERRLEITPGYEAERLMEIYSRCLR